MANAFSYYNDPETSETERFCLMFDQFFDCLNTRSFTEGRRRRKPDLLPYRTSRDTRFEVYLCPSTLCFTKQFTLQWLNDVFLKYLEDWSKEVAQRENFTAAQKQKMMLSQVTLKGLFITGTGGILDVN